MIERVHEHIITELQQNTRTDTIFIITAIILNLLALGINSGVAASNGGATTWIVFFTFVVLVGTGAWLMVFYAPSVERAYNDIQNLETIVTFGILLRNMHRWAAHLIVLAVFLHLCRL